MKETRSYGVKKISITFAKTDVPREKWIETFQSVQRLNDLLDESKTVWEEKSNTNSILKHLEVCTVQTMNCLNLIHNNRVFVKPIFEEKILKKCFTKPPNYNGDIQFAKNKKEALKIFEEI